MDAGTMVRRIGVADARLLRAVRLQSLATDPSSFASTYAREAAFAEEEWRDWAADDAAGAEACTLLALRAGEPVGIVAAYRDGEQQELFHVVAMWVAPDLRRAGIARRLLGEIEAWISSSGGVCAQLRVADGSLAARCLYAGAGYAPDGERAASPHAPESTLVSLRKLLTATGASGRGA